MRQAPTNWSVPSQQVPTGNFLQADTVFLTGDGFLVNQWVYHTSNKGSPFSVGRVGILSHHRRTILGPRPTHPTYKWYVGSFYNPTGEPGDPSYDPAQDHKGGQALIDAVATPLNVWFPLAAAWVSSTERRGWHSGHEAVNTSLSLPRPPNGIRIGVRMDGGDGLIKTCATAEVSVWEIGGLSLADLRSLVARLQTVFEGEAPSALTVNAEQPWAGRLRCYPDLDRNSPTFGQDQSAFGFHFSTVGTLTAFASYPPVARASALPPPQGCP